MRDSPGSGRRRLLTVSIFGLVVGYLAFAARYPANLPAATIPLCVLGLWPTLRAWWSSKGLALRPAFAWSFLGLVLGLVGQIAALGEPIGGGRPQAGHWSYLASLATIAALISVFGARTPGGGAWAILMGLMVLVFLLPWLEGSGLAGAAESMDRLRLETPWSIFFAMLALAGVANYLPTRWSPSALLVGASLIVELVGLVSPSWSAEGRARCWSVAPGLSALGVLAAAGRGADSGAEGPGLPRLWAWFRDRWGVVWALRVRERFNRSAEAAGWPVRLSWHGPIAPDGGEATLIPEAAERTLAALLRRFADAGRIDEVLGRPEGRSCPRGDPGGS